MRTQPTATLLPDAVTKSETGTTADSYADALSLSCYGLNQKSVYVFNTGEENSLTYRILTEAVLDGE